MVLKLREHQAYAIAGKSVSYAQRLFIDGIEYTPAGTPGDSLESVVPKTKRFIEGFIPTGDTTEFIFHYFSFVHSDGGGLYPLEIGLVKNIVHNEQLRTFRMAAVVLAVLRGKLTSILTEAEQALLLSGFGVYAVLSVLGFYAHRTFSSLFGLDYPQTGMLLLLFIHMLPWH